MKNVKITKSAIQPNCLPSRISRKKIIIIDDPSIFRMGLVGALKAPLPEVQIAEAAIVEDALTDCKSADLVLLGISLAQSNVLASIPKIKAAWPHSKIIVLSAACQEDNRIDAVAAGADDLLSKSLMPGQIIARIVLMLDNLIGIPHASPRLTPRQLAILDLMNRGLSNKMIARQFEISEHTVRWHLQSIFTALDASSRSQAIFNARNFGLIT